MIDERHVENFSKQFVEKGYDGKFFALNVEETDLKRCMNAYLKFFSGTEGYKNAFPMTLCSYVDVNEHNPRSRYSLCVFGVDYDQVGGLHISSMKVYQLSDHKMKVAHMITQPCPVNAIPYKSELQHMAYLPERLFDKLPQLPVISAEHLDTFIRILDEKGYTGKFMAPDVPYNQLAHTMLAYLKERPVGIGNKNAFPVWLQTITQGSLITDQRTVCMMKVQYDPNKGFFPDQLRVIRFDTRKGVSINEVVPILLKSINDMPTAQKANALALKNQKTERKRRGLKW